MKHKFSILKYVIMMLFLVPFLGQAQEKPNILVIMGDDIGYWNLSTNNEGMMGYKTPNIDRLANEGAKFTDNFEEQSCTAGRAAFITGQMRVKAGLTKVGIPGAAVGIQKPDSFNLDAVLQSLTAGQEGN